MAQRPSIFMEGRTYLQSFLNKIPDVWANLYWPAFFPLEYNARLDYKYLIADESAHVTASVIAYDASAPEKKRETVKDVRGDIPKLALKRVLGEPEIIEYDTLKADPNVPDDKVIDFVFDDTTYCFNAVQAKRDALALQALSTFTITGTTTTNPDGIILQTDLDLGLPAANKRVIASATSTRDWDNGTTSNYLPITDFWAIMDAAVTAGRQRPRFAIMDLTQWRQFAVADEVLYLVQPQVFNEKNRVNLGEANRALSLESLPQIIVIDKQINDESREGVRTQRNPWTTNYVTFLPELAIGKMFYGPSAEKTHKPAQVSQAERDGILITKWRDVDPIREFTKGESNCFPVIPNVVNCWRLNVTATPQSDGLDN